MVPKGVILAFTKGSRYHNFKLEIVGVKFDFNQSSRDIFAFFLFREVFLPQNNQKQVTINKKPDAHSD